MQQSSSRLQRDFWTTLRAGALVWHRRVHAQKSCAIGFVTDHLGVYVSVYVRPQCSTCLFREGSSSDLLTTMRAGARASLAQARACTKNHVQRCRCASPPPFFSTLSVAGSECQYLNPCLFGNPCLYVNNAMKTTCEALPNGSFTCT